MATIMNQGSTVMGGLDTYQCTVNSQGTYTVRGHATMADVGVSGQTGNGVTPIAPTQSSSGLTITVKQNGTTRSTTTTPASTRDRIEVATKLYCASGDVITVVAASANNADKNINTVKITLSIDQGT